jgi:phosphocarrier protein
MNEPANSTEQCTGGTKPQPRDGAMVRVLTICNRKGLHARASARFVQTVEKFDAEVRVMRCGETVGGTSIMGLMMLAAAPGTSITVEATGREAAEVIEALAQLIDSRFGEKD